MTVTVLIDNAPSSNNNLVMEHGLSLFIETETEKIVCDTGSSGSFADNAKAMGIDFERCDFAFISHGHNDHGGGLHRFFETVKETEVYMHANILSERYYSSRREEKKEISSDKDIIERYKREICFIEDTQRIRDGIFAIQCRNNKNPKPYGNRYLIKHDGKKEISDDFRHEMSLALITKNGLVIISPCSHCGVANIIEECSKATGCNKIHAFIGGFHFVEGNECIAETENLANHILNFYPGTIFYTGHCTCDTAKRILADKLDNIRFFTTGTIIEL